MAGAETLPTRESISGSPRDNSWRTTPASEGIHPIVPPPVNPTGLAYTLPASAGRSHRMQTSASLGSMARVLQAACVYSATTSGPSRA
jgi:hypothetical protein